MGDALAGQVERHLRVVTKQLCTAVDVVLSAAKVGPRSRRRDRGGGNSSKSAQGGGGDGSSGREDSDNDIDDENPLRLAEFFVDLSTKLLVGMDNNFAGGCDSASIATLSDRDLKWKIVETLWLPRIKAMHDALLRIEQISAKSLEEGNGIACSPPQLTKATRLRGNKPLQRTPLGMLSLSHYASVQVVLELVVRWGMYPYYAKGTRSPLQSRICPKQVTLPAYVLNWGSTVGDVRVESLDPEMSPEEANSRLRSCIDVVAPFLKLDAMRSFLLPRYMPDLVIAAMQVEEDRGTDPAVNLESISPSHNVDSILGSMTCAIQMSSLRRLLSECDQAHWMYNVEATYLARCILQPEGVITTIEVMLAGLPQRPEKEGGSGAEGVNAPQQVAALISLCPKTISKREYVTRIVPHLAGILKAGKLDNLDHVDYREVVSLAMFRMGEMYGLSGCKVLLENVVGVLLPMSPQVVEHIFAPADTSMPTVPSFLPNCSFLPFLSYLSVVLPFFFIARFPRSFLPSLPPFFLTNSVFLAVVPSYLTIFTDIDAAKKENESALSEDEVETCLRMVSRLFQCTRMRPKLMRTLMVFLPAFFALCFKASQTKAGVSRECRSILVELLRVGTDVHQGVQRTSLIKWALLVTVLGDPAHDSISRCCESDKRQFLFSQRALVLVRGGNGGLAAKYADVDNGRREGETASGTVDQTLTHSSKNEGGGGMWDLEPLMLSIGDAVVFLIDIFEDSVFETSDVPGDLFIDSLRNIMMLPSNIAEEGDGGVLKKGTHESNCSAATTNMGDDSNPELTSMASILSNPMGWAQRMYRFVSRPLPSAGVALTGEKRDEQGQNSQDGLQHQESPLGMAEFSKLLDMRLVLGMTEKLGPRVLSSGLHVLECIKSCLESTLERLDDNIDAGVEVEDPKEMVSICLGILTVILDLGNEKREAAEEQCLRSMSPGLERVAAIGSLEQMCEMAANLNLAILMRGVKGEGEGDAKEGSGDARGSENSTTTYLTVLQNAKVDLQSTIIPLRAKGIRALLLYVQSLKFSKVVDQDETAFVEAYVEVFLHYLGDHDSFVFLAAVQGLAVLAHYRAAVSIPLLLTAFVDTTRNTTQRIKIGEACMFAVRRSGEILPVYASRFVSAFLFAARPSTTR